MRTRLEGFACPCGLVLCKQPETRSVTQGTRENVSCVFVCLLNPQDQLRNPKLAHHLSFKACRYRIRIWSLSCLALSPSLSRYPSTSLSLLSSSPLSNSRSHSLTHKHTHTHTHFTHANSRVCWSRPRGRRTLRCRCGCRCSAGCTRRRSGPWCGGA